MAEKQPYRLFKPTYKDRDGNTREAERWYVEFRDHARQIRRWPLFPQERRARTTAELLAGLVAVRTGVASMTRDMLSGVETMEGELREKCLAIGLIRTETTNAGKALAAYLDGFAKSVASGAVRADYAALVAARARAVVTGCAFIFPSEINAERVKVWLSDQRKGGKGHDGKSGMSAQTSNFHLQAAKRFGEWLVDQGALPANPLARIKAVPVTNDRRHDRRAMDADEVRRLLDATHNGPEYVGITGPERWLVYCLALETGLRPKQIRGLTRSSFQLTGERPTVTAQAHYSKNKKANAIPLRPAMVELLRAHLAAKVPTASAFRLPSDQMRVRIFRRDLAAARQTWLDEVADNPEALAERTGSDFLAYRDSAGCVADAYSMRHTLITNLVRAGENPKDVQAIAQHADVRTTLNHYAKHKQGEEAAALNRMPALPIPMRLAKENQKKTGNG